MRSKRLATTLGLLISLGYRADAYAQTAAECEQLAFIAEAEVYDTNQQWARYFKLYKTGGMKEATYYNPQLRGTEVGAEYNIRTAHERKPFECKIIRHPTTNAPISVEVSSRMKVWSDVTTDFPLRLRAIASKLKPAPKNGVPFDAQVYYFRNLKYEVLEEATGKVIKSYTDTVVDKNRGDKRAGGFIWLNPPKGWPFP